MQWISAVWTHSFSELKNSEQNKSKPQIWETSLFPPCPEQEVLTALHIYSSELIALCKNDANILKLNNDLWFPSWDDLERPKCALEKKEKKPLKSLAFFG